MLDARTDERPRIQVINGGGAPALANSVGVPSAGRSCAHELAAGMADAYAAALLRDVPLAQYANPLWMVRIDAKTQITLHDLVAELRRLPWYDAQCRAEDLVGSAPRPSQRSLAAINARRESRRITGRPLSLASWAFGTLAPRSGTGPLSRFVSRGPFAPNLAPTGRTENPGRDARMSTWVHWLESTCGVTPPFPPFPKPVHNVETGRDFLTFLSAARADHWFLQAGLTLLAHGMPLDPGLQALSASWNGPTILSLLIEASERAQDIVKDRAEPGRMDRPPVLAARLALMRSHEAMEAGPDTATLGAALGILETCTPNLLTWVARMNRAQGMALSLPSRDGTELPGWLPAPLTANIMLPPCKSGGALVHPAKLRSHALLAGACATILKGVFDCKARFPDPQTPPSGLATTLGRELDSLAANMAFSQIAVGAAFFSESQNDLRRGQEIGLEVLAHHLSGGPSGGLSVVDFDGRRVNLTRRPCGSKVIRTIDGLYSIERYHVQKGAARNHLSVV